MKIVLTLLVLIAVALSPAAIPGAAAARGFSRRSLQQIPGRPMTKPWFGGLNTGSPVGAVPLAATVNNPVATRPAALPAALDSVPGGPVAEPGAAGGDWNMADATDDGDFVPTDLEAVPTATVPAQAVPVTTVPIQATGPVAKPVPVITTGPVAAQPVAAQPLPATVVPAATVNPAAAVNPAFTGSNNSGFYGGAPGINQPQGGALSAMNGPTDVDDDDIVTASGVPTGPITTGPLADGAGFPGAAGWNNAGKPNKYGNKWGNNGNGWGAGGKPWKNNKGNRQTLDPLIGSVNQYPTIRPQPIPVTGPAGPLSQGIFKAGNAQSAAQAIAQAYSNGQMDTAAQAFANAATTATGSNSGAVADVFTEAVVRHPSIAPGLLAKSANLAVTMGQTNAFAATMADAFSYAKQKKCMPAFTTTVADAITTGGASSRYAFGEAIAQAIAGGTDSQAAVAEATAAAFCSGGETASAWSSAYAVALSKDSSGCLVLNQAKAMAQSNCANMMSQSYADSQATSMVLGFCGLLDLVNVNSNFAGGNSGSNTGFGGFQPQYFTGGK